MAAQFAYFSIFSPNSLNANNRISIGLYSEASQITTVKNHQGGGGRGLRVAHGLFELLSHSTQPTQASVTDLKLLLAGNKLIKC